MITEQLQTDFVGVLEEDLKHFIWQTPDDKKELSVNFFHDLCESGNRQIFCSVQYFVIVLMQIALQLHVYISIVTNFEPTQSDSSTCYKPRRFSHSHGLHSDLY